VFETISYVMHACVFFSAFILCSMLFATVLLFEMSFFHPWSVCNITSYQSC